MGTQPLGTFLRRLRQVIGVREGSGLADAQLLERFVAGRDEAAFEVLVWRHGPMVLAVCRRLLRHEQDAEDAFQATFLALARKAGSIARRETLAAWLHRVASRVALRARRRTAQRAAREQPGVEALAVPAAPAVPGELRLVLDQEVNCLPARYRVPFILCYLEGRTQQEVAQQLGCPPGTVASRLAWARDRLRARLTRRGLGLGAAAPLALLLPEGAPAAVPAALVGSTVKAALAFAAGETAVGLATAPAALAEGMLQVMQLAKIKTAVAVLLVLGVLGGGAAWISPAARAGKPPARPGAELVPGTGPSLRLPAEMREDLGVRTAEVNPRAARERLLVLSGSTALDPNRLARVFSRTAGEVVELAGAGADGRPLRVGDRVKKGQLLAVIHSKDLGEKKGELLDALVRMHFDRILLERLEDLWSRGLTTEAAYRQQERSLQTDMNAAARAERTLKTWTVPQEEIDAVKQEARQVIARNNKHNTDKESGWARVEVRAPDDGIIAERNVSLREMVAGNTVHLFQIAKVDRLLVLANAPEDDLPTLNALKPEERVWSVRAVGATAATVLKGPIEEVGHLIDPNQHTAVVKGYIDNPREQFRAGQLVSCTI
jgi:RNA polymerase sigma factor (sigma-70 family)